MHEVQLDNGNITLIRGDCLEVMPKMKAGIIDLILADLPYGTTRCKWDVLIDPKSLWSAIEPIRLGHVLIMAGGWPFYQLANIHNYRYKLYWDKKFGANFTQVKRQPLFSIEEIEVYYKGTYNPQMINRDKPIKSGKRATARTNSGTDSVITYNAPTKIYTEKYPDSIIHIPRELGRMKLHPTQKPVALMEYLIKTYTNEGDLVLDNTMGSGTTAVACINTNRRFVGIEKDTDDKGNSLGYFDICIKRCEEALEIKKTQ